jgi:hypothetical protein
MVEKPGVTSAACNGNSISAPSTNSYTNLSANRHFLDIPLIGLPNNKSGRKQGPELDASSFSVIHTPGNFANWGDQSPLDPSTTLSNGSGAPYQPMGFPQLAETVASHGLDWQKRTLQTIDQNFLQAFNLHHPPHASDTQQSAAAPYTTLDNEPSFSHSNDPSNWTIELEAHHADFPAMSDPTLENSGWPGWDTTFDTQLWGTGDISSVYAPTFHLPTSENNLSSEGRTTRFRSISQATPFPENNLVVETSTRSFSPASSHSTASSYAFNHSAANRGPNVTRGCLPPGRNPSSDHANSLTEVPRMKHGDISPIYDTIRPFGRRAFSNMPRHTLRASLGMAPKDKDGQDFEGSQQHKPAKVYNETAIQGMGLPCQINATGMRAISKDREKRHKRNDEAGSDAIPRDLCLEGPKTIRRDRRGRPEPSAGDGMGGVLSRIMGAHTRVDSEAKLEALTALLEVTTIEDADDNHDITTSDSTPDILVLGKEAKG